MENIIKIHLHEISNTAVIHFSSHSRFLIALDCIQHDSDSCCELVETIYTFNEYDRNATTKKFRTFC